MLKIPFNIGNKLFQLSPYNTKQEKDSVLLSIYDVIDLDLYLNIFNFQETNNIKIEELNENEKIYLLLMYRIISIGNEIDLSFSCSECKKVTKRKLNIPDIIVTVEDDFGIKERDNLLIINNKKIIFKKPDDYINIKKIFNYINEEELDKLTMLEIDKIIAYLNNKIPKFDFKMKNICSNCGNGIDIHLDDKRLLITLFSEQDIKGLYKMYANLLNSGKFTKQDIDSLIPFERSILINLINESIENKEY